MVIVIAGATASGKSDVSLELASRLQTEIISADSMQVYRYFDIGTAKPSIDARKTVIHHCIDIVNPDEEFSAGRFCEIGMDVINRLASEGKTPVIAGGTGLYIKALIEGYSCGVRSDNRIRARIEKDFQTKGNRYMYERLMEIDPEYAEKIHMNDNLRIGRAMEVFYLSGRSFSSYLFEKNWLKDVKYFILYREREDIYERIETRIDEMFDDGLIDEVKGMLHKGYSHDIKPFQSIGYRQVIQYINGEIDYSKCVEDAKKETRHYAKRQCTWLNGVTYGQKVLIDKKDKIENIISDIMRKIGNSSATKAKCPLKGTKTLKKDKNLGI